MSGNNGVPPNSNSGENLNDNSSLVTTSRAGGGLTTGQKLGVGLLIAVVLLAFVWLRAIDHGGHETKLPDVPYAGGQEMHAAPTTPVTPPSPPAGPTLPTPGFFPMMPQQHSHEMTAAESPIFAFSGGSSSGRPPAAAAVGPASSGGNGPDRQARDNPLTARLKTTVLSGAKASLVPHPDMMVTEGTIMQCILDIAIDSQLAGYVKCHLPIDVRSTTGNVVLLDKGTQIVGEIQQGLVQGQTRVFVLWDRAETPDHVIIQLGSPGTDELGRAGLSGRVNNHWWQRFGDAILLSLIQGGLNAGTAAASGSGGGGGGGTTAVFNSFQSNGSQVSDTALQAEINIPPTLEKNQGDAIAIFVAKDLDFSDVYDLRLRGAAYGQ